MNFADNICNTGLHLDLGLGLGPHDDQTENCMKTELRSESQKNQEEESYKYDKFYPSLTLGLPDEVYQIKSDQSAADHKLQLQTASSPSAVSNSFSNSSNSIIKRERDRSVAEEVEKLISRPSTGVGQGDIIDEDGNNLCRKKLRLTKQQSAVLEDSFRDHSTLNPKQKQELARKLNLRARQVEVWFQNRRARTKLKQTEVDCELLKKCCETLTEENKRLQKELQELKSMKTAAAGAFYMQLPATTLTICPSCERICSGGGSSNGGASATTPFFIGSSKGHNFYKSNYSFTHSSAAC